MAFINVSGGGYQPPCAQILHIFTLTLWLALNPTPASRIYGTKGVIDTHAYYGEEIVVP